MYDIGNVRQMERSQIVGARASLGARGLRKFDATLWVPETRLTSCDLLILVKDTAESVVPTDLTGLGRRALWKGV
jgi:hypothetical protein